MSPLKKRDKTEAEATPLDAEHLWHKRIAANIGDLRELARRAELRRAPVELCADDHLRRVQVHPQGDLTIAMALARRGQ